MFEHCYKGLLSTRTTRAKWDLLLAIGGPFIDVEHEKGWRFVSLIAGFRCNGVFNDWAE